MSVQVDITLNIPPPPSVNRLRRVDWASRAQHRNWCLRADLLISAHGPRPPPVRMITGAYEIIIQVPESSRLDLDNHHKAIIDYLVSREFVPGDAKKYLRKLTIEWGGVQAACRVAIRGLP